MRGRVVLIAVAGVVVVMGAAWWMLLGGGSTSPEEPPATTVAVAPSASTMAMPTTAPTVTTLVEASTTVVAEPETETPSSTSTAPAVAQPPATTAATTTTSVLVVTTTAPIATTTEPATTVATVVPSPPGDGSCHGEYVERHSVREQCVIDRLVYLFEALFAGTHTERMSTIRDGHVLGGVFAGLQAYGRENWPKHEDLTSRDSIWEDADARPHRQIDVYGAVWNGPDLLGVRLRVWIPAEGPVHNVWMAAPVVWADGHWLVSYRGFCRFVGRMGNAKQICPKDPRPHIGSETRAIESGSGFYDPWDLDDEERLRVNKVPAW